MHDPRTHDTAELPPPVGLRLAVVSQGLDRAYDRARDLEASGYRVAAFGDPVSAAAAFDRAEPDAIVVDLGREVGFPSDVVARLRRVTDVPIVAVGCSGTTAEMLRCLEAGADEYCRPPCSTDEIDLRLRALLRRIGMAAGREVRPNGSSPGRVRVGAIEIDPASQTVWKDGREVPLSPTEYRLLWTLAEHAGEVVPSKALIARVWGNQYTGETHYLRLYIRYLRQKLEDDPSHPVYIVNRWGAGYALEEPKPTAVAV
ncbi:MAG: winged helix-turn-helix domain-containing protein [Dehalococcoidia bacterium]|nr:winged helix-turn-helix domain-containing protein [Dehalococcoidia bacterium]